MSWRIVCLHTPPALGEYDWADARLSPATTVGEVYAVAARFAWEGPLHISLEPGEEPLAWTVLRSVFHDVHNMDAHTYTVALLNVPRRGQSAEEQQVPLRPTPGRIFEESLRGHTTPEAIASWVTGEGYPLSYDAACACFLVNRSVLVALRTARYMDGSYIWESSMLFNKPPTLFGYPYHEQA